jgi:septal ring factor EnvC (AmiA/AmiB activator)
MKSPNEFFNIKIRLSYVTWIIIIFLAFLLNTCNSKLHYKRSLEKARKERLKEIKGEIEMREDVIKMYEGKIQYHENKIKRLEKQIDSLNSAKKKVEIIYRDRIVKVKEMDSKGITNYWNEAFN